jgi:peptidoglycan/LPS O-acetylase OafA/YrhL
MEHRPEIDGLRALAVIPVILFHAGFQIFKGGYVGVDIFFVISGYLITSIIVAEQQAGRFTILGFYERRARRILPALFVVLLVCLPFAWLWLLPGDMQDFSRSLVAVTGFSSNVFFWLSSSYFDTAAEFKPLLHTWSLGVEEQFYVFFPLFLMATWRFGRRWTWALMCAAAAASLVLAHWTAIVRPNAAFYLLPMRAWELLVGCLTAFYVMNEDRARAGAGLSQTGSAVGLALILYSILAFDAHTPFPGLPALVPTAGAALIILFATPGTWVRRMLANPVATGIGLISYSAYLWHVPLLAFARHASAHEPGRLMMGALVLASLPLAWLSWKHVETPFRTRRRFTRRQIFAYGACGSVLLAIFGLVGHLSNGYTFPFRYRNASRSELALVEATLDSRKSYVYLRFESLLHKPFDPGDPRPKILLMGDSYAEDLTNALHESGLLRHLQLSTHHISRDCGNLFLEQRTFVDKLEQEHRGACAGKGIYEDQTMRAMMREADEVWFASAWMPWQAELVAESLASAQTFTGDPVRIFGRKHLGDVHARQLLALPPVERYRVRDAIPQWTIKVNDTMRRALPREVFIDVQALLCGTDTLRCAPFTSGHELITFDGTHLTPAGARLYGQRLVERTVIGRIFDPAVRRP